MTDTSDSPYGHNTAKFRAIFVRGDGTAAPSQQDVQAKLGYNPLKVPAVFVGEGDRPPGYPFVRVGPAQFRPDPPPDSRPSFTSWRTERPSQSVDDAPTGIEDFSPPPPPTPAAAYPQTNPFGVGLAVWRNMARMVGQRPRRTAPDPDDAASPSGDAPGTTGAA